MKNLITIIICLTPLVAFSQPTDEQKGAAVGFLSKNTIIPPAPEAASLGQYGNVPISFYTGRINLSIPLYEIKGKEISLPISLSYNSGGVKVAEDPGWVGMGWTLNAGGVITRSVFGRPDEYQNYYYLVDSIVKDVTNFSKKGQQDYYLKLTKNLFETQPDAYFFNFGVLSGKFYIKPTQEIVQIEKQSIGFSFDNWYLDNPSFSAVGPDGTKYFFEDKEWTALLYDFDDGGVSIRHSYDFISSWYLTKIISRNKLDTISFNYTVTESLPVSVAPSSESISYNIHGATQTTDGGGGNGATGPCGEGATSTSYGPTTSIARIYLDNITYRDTKVVFTSIDNTSAFGGRQLTEVNVLIDNSQYRKFALEQDYAGSPSETNDERLRLEKIQVYGHSRLASPPYEFTYSSRNLPNKHDKGVDHWGYFNGGGNVSLIPSIPNGDCTFGRDANRKTNKVLVGAGSLKRVTYPTGGHTDFSFGANRRQNAYSGPTIGRVEHGYPVRADVFGGSISSGPCYGKPKYFIQSFTIPSEVTKVTVYPPGNEACEFFHGEGLKVFAGIIEAGRFNADCDMYAYALANLDKFKYHWFMEGDAHPRGSFSGLSPGKYYMILVSDQEIYPIPTVVPPLCAGLNPQQLGGNVTLSLNYYKMELDTIPNNPEDFVGGLRIEKVTDYSADGLVSSTREYEYFESQTFGDPNYMSNSTYSYEAPEFQWIGTPSEPVPSELDWNSKTTTISASSGASLGTVLGSHIGYGKVKEKFTGPGELSNGYKLYTYRNEAIAEAGNFFGIELDTYGRGDLLKEEFYTSADVLKKEVINEYSYDVSEARGIEVINGKMISAEYHQDNSMTLAKSIHTGTYEWMNPINDNDDTVRVNHTEYKVYAVSPRTIYKVKNSLVQYSQHSHWSYLAKSTTREYFDGDTVETYTKNYYDGPVGFSHPSRIEQMDSKGQVWMKNLHYVAGIPVSQENYLAGKLISGQEVDDGVFPDKLKIANKTRTSFNHGMEITQLDYEVRADYDYDSNGDLVQYRKTDDVIQSFIWSDDHKNVISDITGAPHGQSAYTSFEDRAKGGWTFSGATTSESYVPSGLKCYSLGEDRDLIKEDLSLSRTYVVSFRHKEDADVGVTGGHLYQILSTITTPEPGDWQLTTVLIKNTQVVTISGTGIIDDVRLHPLEAQMVSFTHSPLFGVTSQTDESNRTAYFEYDDSGRLLVVRDADKNILKNLIYNYRK